MTAPLWIVYCVCQCRNFENRLTSGEDMHNDKRTSFLKHSVLHTDRHVSHYNDPTLSTKSSCFLAFNF